MAKTYELKLNMSDGTKRTAQFTVPTPTASDVGLGKVNNTSDAEKPISNAQAEVNAQTDAKISKVNLELDELGETVSTHETQLNKLDLEVDELRLTYGLQYIYPVGSIYMSAVNTSPASFLGGTWARLKDRFLLGYGDTYKTAGGTGGSATHKLTTAEMPSHSHTINGASNVYYASGSESMWINKPETNTSYTASTNSTGSGNAHNNMPPYLVVYMWKRTA